MKVSSIPTGIRNRLASHPNPFFWALLAAISLAGMLALWQSTRVGLGLVNDSAAYVNGAENIVLGNGYVRTSGGGELKPITHFPPLFSIVLAGLGLLGIDYLYAAHGLVLGLFGLDCILVGVIALRISRSWWAALMAALTFVFSEIILGVYAFLLSEPLFITLLLGAILMLSKYLATQNLAWLFVHGVMLGLASLTRFVGVSLFAVSLLFLAGFNSKWKDSIRSGLAALAGGLPFILGWMVYTFLQVGSLSNRSVSFHPVLFSKWFEAVKNLLSWMALDPLMELHIIFGWALSALSILLIPALFFWTGWWIWQSKTGPGAVANHLKLAVYLALSVPVYFIFLIFSMSFFDASTPFDNRILSILYVPQMILLWGCVEHLSRPSARWSKTLKSFILIAGVVFVFVNSYDGIRAVEELGREGLGFNHSGWRESPAIHYVRSTTSLVYSNRPTAIYLLTGRTSYIIPSKIDPVTLQQRDTYLEDLEAMKDQIRSGGAVLVFFLEGDEEKPASELTDDIKLVADYGNALVYSSP